MNPLSDKALSGVAALPGVVRVVLTSSDGLVYGQAAGGSGSGTLSADLLSAEITTVTLALGRALSGLSSQKLHRYSFASESHEFLVLNLGRLLLLTAVKVGAELRPVQVEMARVATAMGAELALLEGAA